MAKNRTHRSSRNSRHQKKQQTGQFAGAPPDESGGIIKEWGGRLCVALTMPNTYYVGMSSLALQLLYAQFNAADDVLCERIFWEKGAAESGRPLLSLESGRPADDFDIWAFTISWEMDYFNVVELLRQAGIPPLAADRAAINTMERCSVAVAHRRRTGRDHEPRADGALLRRHPDRRR